LFFHHIYRFRKECSYLEANKKPTTNVSTLFSRGVLS
jgi:hypothetical protein